MKENAQKRISKMKMDALDFVEYYSREFVKELEARSIHITPEIMLKVIAKAIREVRRQMPSTCYIRDINDKEIAAFEIWEKVKQGSMTMKEIYEHINRQTDIPSSTIEKYIIKFRRGYDPTKPNFEDMQEAS
jgi:predicted RNA methylase